MAEGPRTMQSASPPAPKCGVGKPLGYQEFSSGRLTYFVHQEWDPGPSLKGLQEPSWILEKLNLAITNPAINLSYNEKIERALSALRALGIHQEPQPSESVFSKVAHQIKREILDTDNRFEPSPVMVTDAEPSKSSWWMAVLPRTALMFNILAAHLRCTLGAAAQITSIRDSTHTFRLKLKLNHCHLVIISCYTDWITPVPQSRLPNTEEVQEQCQEIYKIACEHEIQRTVEMKLRDYIQKRKPTESIEDCVGETGRKRIRNAIGAPNRVPDGLFNEAYEFVKAAPGTETMSKQMFRNRLGPGFAAEQYRGTLDKLFDTECGDTGEGQVSRTENTMKVQSDEDQEEVTVDDLALERTVQEEAAQRVKKSFYTFTVSLKSIINPNLQKNNRAIDFMDKILSLLSTKQEALSNAIDEIWCVVYKTTLLRSCIPTVLSVTPLPAGLESDIDSPMGSDQSLWTRDLQTLFSYEHLGFLYARFFGPRGNPEDSAANYPLWTHLADMLVEKGAAPSRELLCGDDGNPSTYSLDSLSATLSEIRTEMATNMSNLWEGPLYNKSLDYLLRFLLRFHLAPKREAKYYQRIHDEAKRKSSQTLESNAQKRLSPKTWRDKVVGVENNLGRELRKAAQKTERIDCLFSSLERLASIEPKVEHHRLSFKDRLDMAVQASESSGSDRISMRCLDDKMDDIDEEAEKDDEAEGEQRKPTSDTVEKEPNRAHLRAIQSVTRMLIESPNLDEISTEIGFEKPSKNQKSSHSMNLWL
ncbi:hypothetical protein EC991_008841 [Linnemannia zychae]|nr:hypothetical protein EC991_008841 [Linnemannia zychae]